MVCSSRLDVHLQYLLTYSVISPSCSVHTQICKHTLCAAHLFGSTHELYTSQGYASTKARSGYCPYPYPTVEHDHISKVIFALG
jgi:hypothetical protein